MVALAGSIGIAFVYMLSFLGLYALEEGVDWVGFLTSSVVVGRFRFA